MPVRSLIVVSENGRANQNKKGTKERKGLAKNSMSGGTLSLSLGFHAAERKDGRACWEASPSVVTLHLTWRSAARLVKNASQEIETCLVAGLVAERTRRRLNRTAV